MMQKFTAYEYIKIDLANQFGMDKTNWDVRIDWATKFIEQPITVIDEKIRAAKEPILALKAYNAIKDAKAGIPTGFLMSLDGTASGLQIMACMSGCIVTASNCNLVDTGNRENAYDRVAKLMTAKTVFTYTADQVKKAVMTTFYGSTAQPKAIFGEDTHELSMYYETLYELFPGAMDVMYAIQSCQDPSALNYTCTFPDGHTSSVNVMAPIDKKIEIDELDHATFTHRVYVNQSVDFDLSLPANIVQGTDGYIVRDMYRLAEEQLFELLTIHDSFWASPNFMQNVRENYRDVLCSIADGNLLQDVLREITGNPELVYNKMSNSLSSWIKKSDYALS